MTVFKILQFWVTIEKFGASTCHSFRILEMVIEALQIRFSEKSSGWALRLDFIKIETLKRKMWNCSECCRRIWVNFSEGVFVFENYWGTVI